jgi:hypothetical protein
MNYTQRVNLIIINKIILKKYFITTVTTYIYLYLHKYFYLVLKITEYDSSRTSLIDY